MGITIALAGNPNSGKTTLFNLLTGSKQYVGNWPGVTVEKKTGTYKKDKNVHITDLPGIYSLSPYTLEEVVSRNYLINERPDVIIDVVDASNIERNLYLATQLSEIGIPLVIALNMMDVVRKNGDTINVDEIAKRLGCTVVEISALNNENIDELIHVATSVAEKYKEKPVESIQAFSPEMEKRLTEIENNIASISGDSAKRWLAVKLFERDEKVVEMLNLSDDDVSFIDNVVSGAEDIADDDGEGIVTDERYNFVTTVVADTVKKGRSGLTTSDKIDRIVTNRFLALPIFAIILYFVFYISVDLAAGPVTDIWADGFLGEVVPGFVGDLLETHGASPLLTSLIADGIIGGVGAVIGFLPVIAVLFFFIAILEDVGYMARIAFILDRVFRRFGLSGKSFIPILVGLGCSVSGITGTRTIENDNDRRMTIICASFLPCGAKMDYIAMFAAVFAGAWYGAVWYFVGIAAVIVSGIMLKKTEAFSGEPAPFVMELPEYHMPSMRNVFRATWDRCSAFLYKAGTIILLCSILIWFLSSISTDFTFIDFEESATTSILAVVGKKLGWIFTPLGFGDWIATIASILGLVAKEELVGVIEILSGGTDLEHIIQVFDTRTAVIAFMVFNQLTIPCFAALGAIREEMGSYKWFMIAMGYQLVFSYTIALMIYQFGRFFVDKQPITGWTIVSFVILAIYIYFIVRPAKKQPLCERRLHHYSVENVD